MNNEIGRLKNTSAHGKNIISSRKIYFSGKGLVESHVEMFENMKTEVELKGPAIIESPFTTIVIDPGATVVRKESGSLVISP